MAFKPGQPKPASSGRKPGVKNKRTVVKIEDFILEQNIDLAAEIYNVIQQIADPATRFKSLLEFYRFVDAPMKERVIQQEQSNEETADILSIVTKPNE